MKKLAKIYFSKDVASAVSALAIFLLVLIMTTFHIATGVGLAGLFPDLAIVFCACRLVWAAYKENKDEIERKHDR